MSESLDARSLLDSIATFIESPPNAGTPPSSERPAKIGTIDPAYSVGMPRITFDGESTLSGKGYPWLTPYVPTPGDRVVLLPVGKSLVIFGRVSTAASSSGAAVTGDYEFAAGKGPILRSPDGTRWRLGVSDAGATTWTVI